MVQSHYFYDVCIPYLVYLLSSDTVIAFNNICLFTMGKKLKKKPRKMCKVAPNDGTKMRGAGLRGLNHSKFVLAFYQKIFFEIENRREKICDA